MNKIISIDGPAGSGKERIAKYIARKLNFFHLDSGILYRRLASIFIKNQINYLNNNILKKKLLSISKISSRTHKSLRKEEISKLSSIIAKIPLIRQFVNNQQKKIVENKLRMNKGCVIDGRDIGSKVFKDAKIKLFINVDGKIRAKRRHKQLIELGEKSIHSEILKEINLRDKADKNRKHSPLVIPKGAVIINNSDTFKKTLQSINKALINI